METLQRLDFNKSFRKKEESTGIWKKRLGNCEKNEQMKLVLFQFLYLPLTSFMNLCFCCISMFCPPSFPARDFKIKDSMEEYRIIVFGSRI